MRWVLYIYIYMCVSVCRSLPESAGVSRSQPESAGKFFHPPSGHPEYNLSLSDWWFGTFGLFFHILGIVVPTDFHIFQRGWNHQPEYQFIFQYCFYFYISSIRDNSLILHGELYQWNHYCMSDKLSRYPSRHSCSEIDCTSCPRCPGENLVTK